MPPASFFASDDPAALRLEVDGRTTPAFVQHAARAFVRAHGGSRTDEWSVATAASEATTNIQKFAKRGTILLRIADQNSPEIELIAEDDGPGFDDAERALRDGISEGKDLANTEPGPTRRGLGTGLGAIRRLMGTLTIDRGDRGGARLVARRRLTPTGASTP